MEKNSTSRHAHFAVEQGSEALKSLPADAMDAIGNLVREVRDETLEMVQDRVSKLSETAEDAIPNHSMPRYSKTESANAPVPSRARRGP